ncbi:MAG: PspC domain-containing protein [Woeseiaceae bacterium]|nr:PspC domain-containing protein [Woeseiaceae bacterium]
MTGYEKTLERRFYRNADKALLGGVCAGLADYFGFNLRVTRVLAFIAFLMAMPFSVFVYLAAVVLVPARSAVPERPADPAFRRAMRASPGQAASDVRRRFHSLDRRLARLEKYVTSSRYQLDREFERL